MNCEFCGEALEPLTVCLMGHPVTVAYRGCGCDAATSAREAQEGRILLEAQQLAEYNLAKAVRASGIPERYAKAELTDRTRGMYETAMENGLYIYGERGRGKTYTACAIGIEAIREGHSVRMVKAHRIGDMLRLGTMEDALQLMVSPKLLIIDDIGADNVSEWGVSRLRAVVDERYDSMRPTVFTSNYSIPDLAGRLNRGDAAIQAITSRISEMTVPVLMQGEDFRMVRKS